MRKIRVIFTKEISYYIIAVVLCLIFLTAILQLWNADLKIPFDYHWDTLFGGASIKGAIDTGWFSNNHFIGAPYGFQYYDVNSNVVLDNTIIKLISLVFPNWAITLNLYFLLTFPLVTLAALFVLRKLKVSPLVAIAGSLLFTFLPFHFMQGEPHINLAAYFLIPFAVLLCLWLFEEGFTLTPFIKSQISNRKSQNHNSKLKSEEILGEGLPQGEKGLNKAGNSINWRAIGAIVICLAIGSTFIYYPFFTCFFLLIAGAGAAIARKKWQPLGNAGIMIVIIVAIIIIYNIPSFIYHLQNGANLAFDQSRNANQTEVWGLKVIELLLPVPGNHNPVLGAISDKYQYSSPFVNENQSAALGIIGSIGFVILIVWLFASFFRKEGSNLFIKSQISNLKSQISNLKSQISNLKSQIHNSNLKSDETTDEQKITTEHKTKLKSLLTSLRGGKTGQNIHHHPVSSTGQALNPLPSRERENNRNIFDKIGQLSVLNAAAVLLGTVGGLGTVIAYLGFPEIRTYTRISVFIAFFAIITICWLVDYLIKKTTFSRFTMGVLVVGVMVVGVNDMASPQFLPDYQGIKQEYNNDDSFIKNIEKTYPADKVIFQLPYNAFPESNPPFKMQYYDLFRGYLHSSDISWSYGTMKGRYGDFWYSSLASKPTEEMLKDISLCGFNGIYIDGYGYKDGGKEITQTLATALNVKPLVSDNIRLYFFDMTGYNADLKAKYTAEEYATQQDAALHPLYYELRDGFSPVAGIYVSEKNGKIELINYRSTPVKATLKADFSTGFPEDSTLKIESPILNDEIKINNGSYSYSKDIIVPPGKYELQFSCNALPSYLEGKYYSTVFAASGLTVEEHD